MKKPGNEGITFDQLFNKENWGRALALYPSLTAQDYIEAVCMRQIDVRPLKEKTNWFEPENGMKVITEAAHDFYLTVSGRGGKWNLPSAMTNLARAIQIYSLEAILSEKLIQEVNNAKEGEKTFFDYLHLPCSASTKGKGRHPSEPLVNKECFRGAKNGTTSDNIPETYQIKLTYITYNTLPLWNAYSSSRNSQTGI